MTYRFSDNHPVPIRRLRDPISRKVIDLWETMDACHLQLPDDRVVYIEKGFMFDKASVPRMAWWYLPRDDRYVIDAALVHDKLFDCQEIEGNWISRHEADSIFRDLIELAGMRPTKVAVVYALLRMGSWLPWGRTAKLLGNPYG